ncbi:MAG TPA: hypothetical protein VGM98_15760 [Schlesneria sp.]|jgi:ATP-dependent protease ClpP protease subunit
MIYCGRENHLPEIVRHNQIAGCDVVLLIGEINQPASTAVCREIRRASLFRPMLLVVNSQGGGLEEVWKITQTIIATERRSAELAVDIVHAHGAALLLVMQFPIRFSSPQATVGNLHVPEFSHPPGQQYIMADGGMMLTHTHDDLTWEVGPQWFHRSGGIDTKLFARLQHSTPIIAEQAEAHGLIHYITPGLVDSAAQLYQAFEERINQ